MTTINQCSSFKIITYQTASCLQMTFKVHHFIQSFLLLQEKLFFVGGNADSVRQMDSRKNVINTSRSVFFYSVAQYTVYPDASLLDTPNLYAGLIGYFLKYTPVYI